VNVCFCSLATVNAGRSSRQHTDHDVSHLSGYMAAPRISQKEKGMDFKSSVRKLMLGVLTALSVLTGAGASVTAHAQPTRKPNIGVIMGDNIGIWNIGAYHRGIMAGRTPKLDKMAKEGMLFTDYYAEASCTAGRAAFITGELPIRTGMTTVGQAGAKLGLPAQASTIATVLKSMD